ncbi:MAG: ion transporter, partial [Lentisphaeraceae bacterium]|nr:ion transporter [Lentisphaeraceae bacterium]
MKDTENQLKPWQHRLHEIIYEADTPVGKFFDVALIILILLSVANVMLESVDSIDENYGAILRGFEWFITIVFTVEYVLRLICIKKPWKYALSFYGVIDLMAILP